MDRYELISFIKEYEWKCSEHFECDFCPISMSGVRFCFNKEEPVELETFSNEELSRIVYNIKLRETLNFVCDL